MARGRRRGLVGIAFGLLLMLPNCGPLAAVRSVLRIHNRTVAMRAGTHGVFRVDAYNVLLDDYVAIRVARDLPLLPSEILRVFPETGDLFPDQISFRDGEDCLVVRVATRAPYEFSISNAELRWLPWIGPRFVVGTRKLPLWTAMDLVDGILVVLLSLAWLWFARWWYADLPTADPRAAVAGAGRSAP